MSPNRRLFLNIVATYGRSLFGLVCGLFTARWVLMALGAEALGIFGVVGVVIFLCSTINDTMAGSIGRFYAYVLGRYAVADRKSVLEDCQEWFNVAVLVSVCVPLLLALAGLLAGSWAIDHYFDIPAQYAQSAHWVLRIAIVNMLVGMLCAPFSAMYTAKQNIAELTLYGMLEPICTFVCTWWLLRYEGDRIVFRAVYAAVISSAIYVIIAIRATVVFEECRFSWKKMWNRDKFSQLFSFARWLLVGLSGLTLRNQGAPVVVNKNVGIAYNATISIASTVARHAGALSSALNNAFWPAITNAAGACDREMTYKMALRSCKFGTVLLAFFAIPLMAELDFVINVWLENPPPQVVPTTCLLLLDAVFAQSSVGAVIAVNADGRVKLHEILCLVLHVLTVVALVVFSWTFGVIGVGMGLVLGTLGLAVMRMTLWKIQLGFSLKPWLAQFFAPFVAVSSLAFVCGWAPHLFVQSGWPRLILSGTCATACFVSLSFWFVFDRDEKMFVQRRLLQLLKNHAPGRVGESKKG